MIIGNDYILTEKIKPFHYMLTQDVHTNLGILIAKKDDIITPKTLKKFELYNISKVKAIPRDMNTSEEHLIENTVTPNKPTIAPYKKDEIVKEFEQSYEDHAEKIKSEFIDIVDGKDISSYNVKKTGEDIIKILKYDNDVFSFLSSMKEVDDVTYNHCLNVSIMCQVFGKYLKMSDSEIEALATAGLLHDIGKTKIDQNLINKKGSLNNQEFDLVKNHVIKSYEIIEHQNISNSIKYGVLQHHERFDGSGYVSGLKRKRIHKFAKIIAILDIYDAMTQKRPYRGKIMPLEVLDYLQNNTFTSLDYNLTKSFIDFVSRGFNKAIVQLNTGEEGEIAFMNINNITKPIVKIDSSLIDLSKETELEIIKIY